MISGAGAALVAGGLLSALAGTASWLSAAAGFGAGPPMGLSQALASVGQLAGPAIGFLALAAGPGDWSLVRYQTVVSEVCK